MFNIDYSTVKVGNYRLYLSERPCMTMSTYKKDSCVDDFIHFLKQKDINTVVVLLTNAQISDLYDENLIDVYKNAGLSVIHYPIRDFSAPGDFHSFHLLQRTISKKLKEGNVVIHCSAGLGRTGMVAAGLAVYKGHSAKNAISLIRKIRLGSIETNQQEEFLNTYYSLTQRFKNKS